MRFERQLHHSGIIAEIMEFAVTPSMRNLGIGKAMFAEALQTAKTAGCMQIEVACNCLRHDTHRFYSSRGMNKFHYKFSLPLTGEVITENKPGL